MSVLLTSSKKAVQDKLLTKKLKKKAKRFVLNRFIVKIIDKGKTI